MSSIAATRQSRVGPYTPLVPRQKIQTQPYAAYALTIGIAGLTGTYSNALNFSNAGNTFVGNGGGLTNLNAAIASGLLADGRLSGTYSSALTLSNPANVLAGNGAAITNLNAANVTGVIPDSAGGHVHRRADIQQRSELVRERQDQETELLFLAIFLRLLKPGGRAAVIVPDGGLFGSSRAQATETLQNRKSV